MFDQAPFGVFEFNGWHISFYRYQVDMGVPFSDVEIDSYVIFSVLTCEVLLVSIVLLVYLNSPNAL
jgi:hypothetical protein